MSSPSAPGDDQATVRQRDRGLDGRRHALLHTTRQALGRQDLSTLGLVLNNQHAADLAQLFRNIDEQQQQRALQILAGALGLIVRDRSPIRYAHPSNLAPSAAIPWTRSRAKTATNPP